MITTLALTSCGSQSNGTAHLLSAGATGSAGAAADAGSPVRPAVDAVPGKVTGTVTITRCSGTVPQGGTRPACTTQPVAGMKLAIATLKDGVYTLVDQVVTDATGKYSDVLPPGDYVVLDRYSVTLDPADEAELHGESAAFSLKGGDAVEADLRYAPSSPPPPIQIGVSN
jgi:hypothetical protein